METNIERSFVRSRLPWLVAAGTLAVYLLTLDHALSLMNLTGLAKIRGWDWHPVYQAPLFYALTLPIRWLPDTWQMFAANAFAAVCGALTLALLARSVALLPHDRTIQQRSLEPHPAGLLSIKTAWIPPLLAVLVCGLQLSFWEQSTVASGEMLDLLVLACVVWCLLEYRVSGRESWLSRLAFVFGLGIANNWAMLGIFPLFLLAFVWTMGLGFFRYRFLLRTALWALAGLSLYLLLPAIQSANDPAHSNFVQALRYNLGFQKYALTQFRPYLVLLLSLTSLMPLLVLSIRWPSAMGDISPSGFALTNRLLTIVHGALFLVCLYTAFDPAFSPRQLGVRTGSPLLSYYYAAALAIGYFCGYFLLVFGPTTGKPWARPSAVRVFLNRVVSVVVWLLAAGVPAGLIVQNFPLIQARNSSELDRYGRRLAESLPPQGAVIMSDDPIRLYAVRAALGARVGQYVLFDTTALTLPDYHRYLKRTYGNRLPETPPLAYETFPPSTLQDYIQAVSARQTVCYLHPSFGYYFERFYQVPRGLVYDLKLCPTNSLETPAWPLERVKEQDAYWQRLEQEDLTRLQDKVSRMTGRKKKSDYNLQWAASYYSRACNDWGARLQAAGLLDRAAHSYEIALSLNPENPCAFVNLEWCQHWKKTGKLLERFTDEAMSRLAPYAGNWDVLLSINGPLDEPTFRLELARLLAANNEYRQAAQQVLRILAIDSKQPSAQLLLGSLYLQANLSDRALDLVAKLRPDPLYTSSEINQIGLIQIEAWAWYAKGDLAKAEGLLRGAQQTFTQQEGGFFTLAQMHLALAEQSRAQGKQTDSLQHMTNALSVFELQVKAQPTNLLALVNYGGLSSQLEDFPRAIAMLSRAITLDPQSEPARLNRAISELRSGQLDEARKDYDFLLRINPSSYRAYYGLAEIATQRKEWRNVADNCDFYLKHAPPGTAEYLDVEKRLAEAKHKSK